MVRICKAGRLARSLLSLGATAQQDKVLPGQTAGCGSKWSREAAANLQQLGRGWRDSGAVVRRRYGARHDWSLACHPPSVTSDKGSVAQTLVSGLRLSWFSPAQPSSDASFKVAKKKRQKRKGSNR